MTLLARLWTYQAERFPLARTAALVAVFSGASVSASAHFAVRALPGWPVYALAFAVTLIFFFQLRVLDEIKDADDDARFRPERPIPRGLVSLRFIVGLGVATVPLALGATLIVEPTVLPLLLLAWGWMALMTREFFVPAWLNARPVAYMVSHMAIMPLIDLFVTGTEWRLHGAPPPGLGLFLALSFANGCILEIGRKLWAVESERAGVETYSALWGPRRAATVWLGCLGLAFMLLVAVGFATGAPLTTAAIGAVALAFAARAALAYRKAPTPRAQAGADSGAGAWVFACYVAAGFSPTIAGWLS